MKVYRIPAGTYFEKQEDARKADRKFEPVEFPFAASPKADFVAWLNEQGTGECPPFSGLASPEPAGPEWRLEPQPQPTQPVQPQSILDRAAIDAMWPNLPLEYRFGLCAMTMEDARNTDWFKTTPAKAPQPYGGGQ